MTLLLVCIAVFLMLLGMSLFAIIYTAKKYSGKTIAYIAGFLAFFVTQLIIRIPLLQLASLNPAFTAFAAQYTVLFGFIQAFTASLFEGAGRLIFGYLLLKKYLLPANGVRLGVGHAVTEVMLLVGVSYLSNIFFAAVALSPASMESMIAAAPQLASVFQNFINPLPVSMFFIAALERFIAIFAQIGLGIIAVYALYKKSVKYALLMFAMHFLLDSFAPIFTLIGISLQNIIVVELWVAIISAAIFFIACRIYKKWQDQINSAAEQNPQPVLED